MLTLLLRPAELEAGAGSAPGLSLQGELGPLQGSESPPVTQRKWLAA